MVVALIVALAEQHSGLSLLWLIRTLASTLTCHHAGLWLVVTLNAGWTLGEHWLAVMLLDTLD